MLRFSREIVQRRVSFGFWVVVIGLVLVEQVAVVAYDCLVIPFGGGGSNGGGDSGGTDVAALGAAISVCSEQMSCIKDSIS